MNTAFLLMAQYNGAAIIPVEAVCRDYFSHLDPIKFVAKATKGDMSNKEALRKAGIGYHEVVAGHTTPGELKRLVEKLVPAPERAPVEPA